MEFATKKLPFVLIPSALFAVATLAFRGTFGASALTARFFPALAVCCGVGVLLAALMQLCPRVSLAKMAFILVLFFGCLFTFVFPPNAVPDEPVHFAATYQNVDAALGDDITNPETIPLRLADLRIYYRYHYPFPDARSYESFYEGLTGPRPTGGLLSSYEGDRFAGVPYPYVYYPQTLGFLIARGFSLSPEWLVLLGRLFNLLCFAAAVWAAIRIAPFGGGVFALVALYPLCLQQAPSLSYDTVTIALGFLALAQYLRLTRLEGPARPVELILFLATVFLLGPPKVVFLPFFLLVFLLPRTCFVTKHQEIVFKIAVVLVFFAALALVGWNYLHRGDGGVPVITYGDGPFYTFADITETPRFFAAMCWHTIKQFWEFYLNSMIGAELGHLEVSVNKVIIEAFLALSILAGFRTDTEKSLSRKERILFALLFLIAAFGTLLIMFVSWTPVGSGVILGIQGRYFLPVWPSVLLAVTGWKLPLRRHLTDKRLVLAATVLLVPVLYTAFTHIATRGL
ncbi:MAG: DUF2142 domain-containing protein [Clostridiales Family XIII bacterium]|jgi:uncharacterized membrane protein|nr:DUF2142 domain-containing protein [Clostridiales Family XIII bacterium]